MFAYSWSPLRSIPPPFVLNEDRYADDGRPVKSVLARCIFSEAGAHVGELLFAPTGPLSDQGKAFFAARCARILFLFRCFPLLNALPRDTAKSREQSFSAMPSCIHVFVRLAKARSNLISYCTSLCLLFVAWIYLNHLRLLKKQLIDMASTPRATSRQVVVLGLHRHVSSSFASCTHQLNDELITHSVPATNRGQMQNALRVSDRSKSVRIGGP